MVFSSLVVLAEVMDKMPTALDNWKFLLLPGVIGGLVVLGVVLSDRWLCPWIETRLLRWICALCANALTCLQAVFWGAAISWELFSLELSWRGFRAEGGDEYILQFGLATVLSLALPHLGHFLFRRPTFVNSQSVASKPNMLGPVDS